MFYHVLSGFTGFYWVLLSFTGFYRVLLGFTGFYWVLLGFTGFFSRFYWVLLGFTGFYLVSLYGMRRPRSVLDSSQSLSDQNNTRVLRSSFVCLFFFGCSLRFTLFSTNFQERGAHFFVLLTGFRLPSFSRFLLHRDLHPVFFYTCRSHFLHFPTFGFPLLFLLPFLRFFYEDFSRELLCSHFFCLILFLQNWLQLLLVIYCQRLASCFLIECQSVFH